MIPEIFFAIKLDLGTGEVILLAVFFLLIVAFEFYTRGRALGWFRSDEEKSLIKENKESRESIRKIKRELTDQDKKIDRIEKKLDSAIDKGSSFREYVKEQKTAENEIIKETQSVLVEINDHLVSDINSIKNTVAKLDNEQARKILERNQEEAFDRIEAINIAVNQIKNIVNVKEGTGVHPYACYCTKCINASSGNPISKLSESVEALRRHSKDIQKPLIHVSEQLTVLVGHLSTSSNELQKAVNNLIQKISELIK